MAAADNAEERHNGRGETFREARDARLKRLEAILGGKVVLADLHDERTNKRLLVKGTAKRVK